MPRSVSTASIAPAAPIVWPIWDLFDETGTSRARSPSRRFRARVSTGSLIDVDVPWAFTYSTSAGRTPASSRARCIARSAPRPRGAPR